MWIQVILISDSDFIVFEKICICKKYNRFCVLLVHKQETMQEKVISKTRNTQNLIIL